MVFGKKLSDSLKGIAIVLMLLHHLFTSELIEKWAVNTIPFTREQMGQLCIQFKICVGIFVFITAYGMTRHYMSQKQLDKDNLFTYSKERCVKVALNFFVIYILGLIGHAVFLKDVTQIYNAGNNPVLMFINIIIDAVGLNQYLATPTLNATWWYISIAYILIFLVPIMVLLYRKAGKLLLLVCCFNVIPVLALLNPYLFVVIMGIWAAEESIFEKLYEKFHSQNKFLQIVQLILCFAVTGFLVYLRHLTNWTYLIDGICPLTIGYFLMLLTDCGKFVVNILGFLGKYSMNIFLLHTFIYYYFFTEYIYKFHNWVLIFLACFGASLLLSILIELLKKKLGFYTLVNNITSK